MATMERSTLEGKIAAELHQIAADLGIEGHRGLKKDRILARTNGASPAAAPRTPPLTETEPPHARPAETNGDARVEGRDASGSGEPATREGGDAPPREPRRDERHHDRPREREGGRPDDRRFDGREGGTTAPSTRSVRALANALTVEPRELATPHEVAELRRVLGQPPQTDGKVSDRLDSWDDDGGAAHPETSSQAERV